MFLVRPLQNCSENALIFDRGPFRTEVGSNTTGALAVLAVVLVAVLAVVLAAVSFMS